MAELHDLKPAEGSTRDRKRVGRGPGSGTGKTAGRGQKGQKSRSGGGVPRWFEGGQMPLQRRIPKRGFTPLKRTTYQIVNVGDLARVEGDVVNPETLGAAGLVRAPEGLVKLLGNGEVERAFKVEVHAISAGARSKIEAAGGSVALLERGAAAAEAEAVEVAEAAPAPEGAADEEAPEADEAGEAASDESQG